MEKPQTNVRNEKTVEQRAAVRELWLHFLWKSGRLNDCALICTKGRSITVLSAGWYNRGWGPDFREAKILLGQDEYFGDIEIHVDESAWYGHGHHLDAAYNRVILHVFLHRGKTAAVNQLRQPLAGLHLGTLRQGTLEKTIPLHPASIEDVPGACGLRLGKKNVSKLKKFLMQASEQRLLQKTELLERDLPNLGPKEQEDLLYTRICRSLGYSAHADLMTQLSLHYPYSKLKPLFSTSHRQVRVEVLSRWFGCGGILSSVDQNGLHDDMRREWLAFRQFWQNLSAEGIDATHFPKQASRPLNRPARRLTGLFYHLEKTDFYGLFKSWLRFVVRCGKLIETERKARRFLLSELDAMFPQPDWEPFARLVDAGSCGKTSGPMKLIGRQRQLIVLVNAVIPFFLAWARLEDRKEIEKILFSLFLVLPPEGGNRKTKFMENRLAIKTNGILIRKNLSSHQGLIQFHEDCCRCFYQGCGNCSLLKLLGEE